MPFFYASCPDREPGDRLGSIKAILRWPRGIRGAGATSGGVARRLCERPRRALAARGRPGVPGAPRALDASHRARALDAGRSVRRALVAHLTASSPASRSTRRRASVGACHRPRDGDRHRRDGDGGRGCLLYKGVVLGGASLERDGPPPTDQATASSSDRTRASWRDRHRRARAHRIGERRRRPRPCRRHRGRRPGARHRPGEAPRSTPRSTTPTSPTPSQDMIRALAAQNERSARASRRSRPSSASPTSRSPPSPAVRRRRAPTGDGG